MIRYLFKEKLLFWALILFTMLVAFLDVVYSFALKYLLDFAQKGSLVKFAEVCFNAIIFVLIYNFFKYIREIVQNLYMKRTMVSFRNDIFRRTLNIKIKEFRNRNSSEYTSILINDVSLIENDYFQNIFLIIQILITFVLSVAALLTINKLLTIAVLVIGLLSALLPLVLGKYLSKYKMQLSKAQSVFVVKLKDIFGGFEIVKSFNIEKKISNDFKKINIDVEQSKFKFAGIVSALKVLSNGLSNMTMVGVFLIGSYFIISNNLTVGETVASLQLAVNIISPLTSLTICINRINSNKVIIKKIENMLGEKQNKKEMTLLTFENNIVFDNVEFGYTSTKNIINGCNINIQSGKKYAVVGGSGSGKSTILKLILGYYDNYKGSIKIDDNEVKHISESSINNIIATMQQDVYLFDDNLRNNITLYKDYSDKEVIRIAKLVGLKKVIGKNGELLGNYVGENGYCLSGGEKQRVAIARALIKKTQIILFDEATASIDNTNTYEIENLLLSIKDLTSIVVTHKLIRQLLVKYDDIYVVEDGKIVEHNTFNELMQNKSYFYNLYNVGKIDILKPV